MERSLNEHNRFEFLSNLAECANDELLRALSSAIRTNSPLSSPPHSKRPFYHECRSSVGNIKEINVSLEELWQFQQDLMQ